MKAYVSGLPVSMESFDEILADMEEKIAARSSCNYISITNTESMYHALRIEPHRTFIQNADHSLCDGIGVVIAGYFWGVDIPRRNGPVLMLEACERGLEKGWRHYFYGGKEGVPELLEEKLKEQFPDLNVVGSYSPPFGELTAEQKQDIIERIRATRPDIVWVGLGLLKQEACVAEFLDQIEAPWMVGVGAAFDYHAGTVSWAPKWIRALGMEWLYRTILQPRLRIQRYIWSFDFMFSSIFDAIKQRLSGTLKNKD